MSLLQNSNAISTGGADYNLESSLRFRSSASAYLNWTPASAGNRKTWTWSAWIKRGSLSSYQHLFFGSTGDYNPGDVVSFLRFDNTDTISFFDVTASVANNFYYSGSSRVFRDTSSWYHFVIKVDTTQATASDRFKIYVNNEEITSWSSTVNPTLNAQTGVNSSTGIHRIGLYRTTIPYAFDGYMTEVNFIDGQALTPSDFGEYDDTTGVWKPKEYTGTYGTNGFYLPFKETQQATGFNTVTYSANNSTQSITGVGFSPDLVWTKSRSNAYSHFLYDSVRGATKPLVPNLTSAETTYANSLTSFDSDGFTLGASDNSNVNGNSVAWCWDAGSSTVSNTDGTITSSVRANPASGFSIVTYTGNGTAGATIGHGLGVAPSMIIIKDRSATFDWSVYHSGIGNTKYIFLNRTDASATSATFWNNTSPTNNVFTLGSTGFVNNNGSNLVAYCFADVEGFSKFGSYTGNNSADGPFVYTGFRPAFIMFKRTDSAQNWFIFDNTRSPYNTIDEELRPNTSAAEVTGSTNVDYLSNGFKIYYSGTAGINQAGNYIYMAFAENPFKQSLAR